MTERRSTAYREMTITNQPKTDSTKGVGETVSLTPAETRVLALLPTYRTLAAIGAELGVGRPTVKTHVENIYKKLEATTRAEAVTIAGSVGLLPPSVPDGQPPTFTFR
jgi:DNA-binding CsgD family transcriptional regulator